MSSLIKVFCIPISLVISIMTTALLAQQAEQSFDFDIPAGPITTALVAFGLQTGITIGSADLNVNQLNSSGLIGRYTLSAGIRQLLADTGLAAEIADQQTIRIYRPAPALTQSHLQQPTATDQPKIHRVAALTPIMVTATKRNSRVDRLPVSVGVVDGDNIQDLGLDGINDVASRLAGVTVTNLGRGRNKIFVRGLSDGGFADRTQSTVGIYLDENLLTFSDTNPDLRLIDIDRIEVVRGPQGSLYGAGSIGGVFRMVTNKPNLNETSAAVKLYTEFTRDGEQSQGVDTVFNMPLISGKLGFRLATYYERQGGYIDDIALGQKNINDNEIIGGRALLDWKISDAWMAEFGLNFQDIKADDTQYFFASLSPLNRANFLPEPFNDDFLQFSIGFKGQLGFAELNSTTAFIDRDIVLQTDATAAIPELIDITGIISPFNQSSFSQTFSHESRLISNTDNNWEWLAGVFYLQRDERRSSMITVPGVLEILNDPALTNDIIFNETRDDDVRQMALFGEASYAIGDFGFTLGLRLFDTLLSVTSVSDGAANNGLAVIEGSNGQTGLTPKFVLSYRLAEDLLTYAQVTQGFRVGGVNVNTPINALLALDPDEAGEPFTTFDSDTLWNFEIGAKSHWFDRKLAFNVAAFYINWSDIQTDQLFPTGLSFVANAGNARNLGVEVELQAFPFPGLEVLGNFFWNEPELVTQNTFLSAQIGDRLPNIADISAGAAVIYDLPDFGSIQPKVSLDYSFVGESVLLFSEDISPEQGNYHELNLRFSVNTEHLSAGVYIENLLNARGNTFAFGNPFNLGSETQITPLRPRTIGAFLELSY